MKKLTTFDLTRAQALMLELPMIEHKLREAGLFATATVMNKVVQRGGYELASLIRKGDEA